jgi:hypothetical protein
MVLKVLNIIHTVICLLLVCLTMCYELHQLQMLNEGMILNDEVGYAGKWL